MNRLQFLKRTALAVAISCIAPFAFAQAQVKLTLGHGAAPGNPRHEAAVLFAQKVKEGTNGRIEVQVAHSAQLGDDAAMVTAIRSGSLDISANSQGTMAVVVPEYAAFGLPFLFGDITKAWAVLEGPMGQELAKKTADKGMILLSYWDNGIRQTTNSKRPLLKPADFQGLKIRTPPDAVTIDIMKALGADPQQLKFSELYVALQQGVVDGQENPIANIHASKLYEVQKYLSMTGHKYEMTPFVMSKRSWDKLAPADQKVIMDAAATAAKMQRTLSRAADDKLLGDIKAAGVKVDTVDKALFVAATKPVYDKWSTGPMADFVKRLIAASK